MNHKLAGLLLLSAVFAALSSCSAPGLDRSRVSESAPAALIALNG